jgi:hypothetical protein
MRGHSRSKNGVAEFTLGLAEGKTRGLADVPRIHVFLSRRRGCAGTSLAMTTRAIGEKL